MTDDKPDPKERRHDALIKLIESSLPVEFHDYGPNGGLVFRTRCGIVTSGGTANARAPRPATPVASCSGRIVTAPVDPKSLHLVDVVAQALADALAIHLEEHASPEVVDVDVDGYMSAQPNAADPEA